MAWLIESAPPQAQALLLLCPPSSARLPFSAMTPDDADLAVRLADGSDKCCHCLKTGWRLKRCGGCKVVEYCSKQCQKAAWSVHRLVDYWPAYMRAYINLYSHFFPIDSPVARTDASKASLDH